MPIEETTRPLRDVLRRLESLGQVTREGDSYRAKCPLHGGRSLMVSAGKKQPVVMKCMGSVDCTTADILRALDLSMKDLFENAASSGKNITESLDPVENEASVLEWHDQLLTYERAKTYLKKRRGLSLETLDHFKLGYDGERITIPIYCGTKLVNVRRYHPALTPKILGAKGRGTQLWIPDEDALRRQEWALLCEGELDALVGWQHGLPTATGTGGAGGWKREWVEELRNLDVVIAYDCDEAGMRGAEEVANKIWMLVKSVRILNLGLGQGEDITDWFVVHGFSAEDLRDRIRSTPEWAPSSRTRIVDGATFVFSQPDVIPAIWGLGDQVLWAKDEGLMIVGPQGVGKTTLAQQLILARIGVIPPVVVDFPVAAKRERILYLAMDRPAQAARSLARMVRPKHAQKLRDRLIVWRGPLEFDPTKDSRTLADFAEGLNATTLVIDSLKDLAPGLAQDEIGSAINMALQEVIVRGIQVLVLHHQRKPTADNKRPTSLSDTYGSTWLTAGMGSVVLLQGKPGSATVELIHLKQPVDVVGPLRVVHDHDSGTSSVEDHMQALRDLIVRAGSDGITEPDAAAHLFGDDANAERKKARRLLDKLAKSGSVTHIEGKRGGPGGGGVPARWRSVDSRNDAQTTKPKRNPKGRTA